MDKITPPLQKGGRRQEQTTIKAYRSTVDKLDELVESKKTTRIEYLRWLVDCAEAGLAGPTADLDKAQAIQTTLFGLSNGDIDPGEAYRDISQTLVVVVREACQDTRAVVEAEWSGANEQ